MKNLLKKSEDKALEISTNLARKLIMLCNESLHEYEEFVNLEVNKLSDKNLANFIFNEACDKYIQVIPKIIEITLNNLTIEKHEVPKSKEELN